jgi:hypothetical protein
MNDSQSKITKRIIKNDPEMIQMIESVGKDLKTVTGQEQQSLQSQVPQSWRSGELKFETSPG